MFYFILITRFIFSYPEHVRLSWTKPDASTTMTITWNTEKDEGVPVCEFGETDSYGSVKEGYVFQAKGDLKFINVVELENLKPDTVYHYRVGNNGKWSDDHTFKTAPKDGCAPFTFIVLGDNRGDTDWGPSPRWKKILEEAASTKPAFILNTGDIVKDGKETKQWVQFLEASDPYQADVPIMYSIGNHDDDSVEGNDASYNQVFSLPTNDVTNTEDFYYFKYGNAIFVSLSTQTFTGGDYPFEEQAKWLDKVLTENPAKWKFVFFHHPVYTSSADILGYDVSHPSNEKNQNQAFIPVFDKHHVDFVFNGHNHFYERFKPMVKGNSWDEGKIVSSPADGTIYVVTGGAGALTYSLVSLFICGQQKGSYKCSGNHHYIKITVDGNHLTYVTHETKAQLYGTSDSNAKDIDFIKIDKPGEPECSQAVVEPDNYEKVESAEEVKDVVETYETLAPDVIESGEEIVFHDLKEWKDEKAVEVFEIKTENDQDEAKKEDANSDNNKKDAAKSLDGTIDLKVNDSAIEKVETPVQTESAGGSCSCQLSSSQRFNISYFIIILVGILMFLKIRFKKSS